MKPTRASELLALLAVGLLVGVLLFGLAYDHLAGLPVATPVGLALLGGAEGWGAGSAKARLERRPGTRRLDPLVAARLAVLAKASSAGGALVGGFFGGGLAWLLLRARGETVHRDILVSAFGLLAGALLTGSAMWLESVCRVPPEDHDPSAA